MKETVHVEVSISSKLFRVQRSECWRLTVAVCPGLHCDVLHVEVHSESFVPLIQMIVIF